MCSWCFFFVGVWWGSIQGGLKAEMLNRGSFYMLLDGYALGHDFYRKEEINLVTIFLPLSLVHFCCQ